MRGAGCDARNVLGVGYPRPQGGGFRGGDWISRVATACCAVPTLRIVRLTLNVAALMKVDVENQPQGLATLRIELPPEEVRKEWDSIASNYSRYARIPGYRAGKAPRQVIEKKFRKEIQDELTKKLVSKSYHEAIAEKQLRVVSLTDLGDVEFGDDRSMRFRATVVTAPEFELPEYKNIPVQLPATEVTEAEIDAALERLRDQAA